MLDSRLTVSSRIHKFVIAFVLFQVASFLLLFALFLFPVLFFVCALVFWLFSLYLFSRRLYRLLLVLFRGEVSAAGPEAGSGASLNPAALVDFARLILSQSDGGNK